jgi:hypothetical protein
MQIQPYTSDLEGAVSAFNSRLLAGGSAFQFRASSVPSWLPKREGREIYEEYFVAVDGGAVRGGYVLKHQPFALGGKTQTVTNINLPLSEGSIDPRYNMLAVQILSDALKRRPLLFALGMGSYRNTITRLLEALGWSMYSLPFFFRVIRPERFLRHIQPLRCRAPLRTLLRALAAGGAGAILPPLHSFLTHPLPQATSMSWEVAESFGAWADDVWEEAKAAYSLIALRDRESLNVLYPPENRKAIRLKVMYGPEVAGWAVVLDTQMTDHKHFGGMRVGSVIDCLARPGRETAVVEAATAFLAGSGVDLVVSNQAQAVWGAAFRKSGYLRGPSNFIFAASRKLAERLAPFDVQTARMHVNRGDGEGPTHL